jgi:hypothetical protein
LVVKCPIHPSIQCEKHGADWFNDHGLDPADPQVISGNPVHDVLKIFQEWMADTDPTNALSYFRIEAISNHSRVTVHFQTSSNRVYSLLSAANLAEANWTVVPGQIAVPGTGGLDSLMDTNTAPAQFYRVGVRPPP